MTVMMEKDTIDVGCKCSQDGFQDEAEGRWRLRDVLEAVEGTDGNLSLRKVLGCWEGGKTGEI